MNILFVCTGNAARSVMAEGITKKHLADIGKEDIIVRSCGTDTLPFFEVPGVVIDIMKEHGVDLSLHKPTRITKELIQDSDLVLVMENYHKEQISSIYPEFKKRVYLLKEYTDDKTGFEVPDPIGQQKTVYENTFNDIELSVLKLIEKIKNN